MRGSIRIGSIAGIPLLISPSWLLIFALFTYLLSAQFYPEQIDGMSTTGHWVLGALSSLLFFGCIILHELAHSLVARRHRIPVHSITLFMFGGVAQIAREARRPRIEFFIAIVGPLTSLAIAGIFLGAAFALQSVVADAAFAVLAFLALINAALGIFNLLPAFPMDGGRVFRSAVWAITGSYLRASVIAAWSGRVMYWGIIAAGMAVLFGVDLVVASGTINGIWLILIGFTLEGFARQSLVQTRVLRTLQEYRASDIMATDLPTVAGADNLGALARGAFQINPRLTYFVEDEGKLAGILTMFQVFSVPEASWDATTVGEAMLPSSDLHPVEPNQPVSDILMDMEADNLTHMPVVESGRVIGLVGRDGIVSILRRAPGATSA